MIRRLEREQATLIRWPGSVDDRVARLSYFNEVTRVSG
jgi:hypothetical protein